MKKDFLKFLKEGSNHEFYTTLMFDLFRLFEKQEKDS